jgi:hypothetical protein
MAFKILKQDEQALFSLDVNLVTLGDMLLSSSNDDYNYALNIMHTSKVKWNWLLNYLDTNRSYSVFTYTYKFACNKIKDLERRRQYLKRLKINKNN